MLRGVESSKVCLSKLKYFNVQGIKCDGLPPYNSVKLKITAENSLRNVTERSMEITFPTMQSQYITLFIIKSIGTYPSNKEKSWKNLTRIMENHSDFNTMQTFYMNFFQFELQTQDIISHSITNILSQPKRCIRILKITYFSFHNILLKMAVMCDVSVAIWSNEHAILHTAYWILQNHLMKPVW